MTRHAVRCAWQCTDTSADSVAAQMQRGVFVAYEDYSEALEFSPPFPVPPSLIASHSQG